MATALQIPRKASGVITNYTNVPGVFPSKPPPKQRTPIGGALAGAFPGLDPSLRALSPGQLSSQATASVSAQTQPIIDQITRAIQAQTAYGNNAIGSLTGNLQSRLAPFAGQASAEYGSAGDALAGLSSALADRLAQAGVAQQTATGGALGAAGQNTAPADRAAAFGTGASAAGAAMNDADINALRTQGLAATDYARSLPGIAGLMGIQQAGQFASTQAGNLADQTGQVTAQVPGLVQSVLSGLQQNELAKSQSRQSYGQAKATFQANQTQTRTVNAANAKQAKIVNAANAKKITDEEITTKAGIILANGVDPKTGTLTPAASKQLSKLLGIPGLTGVSSSTAATIAGNKVSEQQRGEQLAIDLQRVRDTEAKTAAGQAPKFNASISKAVGYRADQYGNPLGGSVTLLPGYTYNAKGDVVKTTTAGTKKQHGLTPEQVQTKTGTALTLAETAFKGGADSKANPLPPLTYQQAVLEAEKEGLPAWIYLPALNSFYLPGGSNSTLDGPPAQKR